MPLMRSATAWNSAFSLASRSSLALRSLAIMALLASVTAMASPRGRRKFRPYPSATFTTSPRRPSLSTSSLKITSIETSSRKPLRRPRVLLRLGVLAEIEPHVQKPDQAQDLGGPGVDDDQNDHGPAQEGRRGQALRVVPDHGQALQGEEEGDHQEHVVARG